MLPVIIVGAAITWLGTKMVKSLVEESSHRSEPDHTDDHRTNDDHHEPWGGFGRENKSCSQPLEFNPSESAGEAFRSVFGDDNKEN